MKTNKQNEIGHTPGPWGTTSNRNETRPEMIFSEPRGNTCVATTWAIVPEHERIANARLIASAPELFGMLRELVRIAEQCRVPEFDTLRAAKLAIEKAAGN